MFWAATYPPPNTLGLHRVMFAVDDTDDTVTRLRAHGAELLGEIAQYESIFLLRHLRYGALAKLERAGLVEALPAEDRRRPYRITVVGREFLHERLTESARIAEVGLRRIAVASS